MNRTTLPATTHHTMQYLLDKENAVFSQIPGMQDLLHANPDNLLELEAQYPDAAFALMTAQNLFVGDKEQNEIHQKAYAAILNGESIRNVRFRYDYDLEAYLERHMWD